MISPEAGLTPSINRTPTIPNYVSNLINKHGAGKKNKDEQNQVNNLDLFFVDFQFFKLKGDMGCLELPIFTLQTKKDLKNWNWQSNDGRTKLKVIPNNFGRATLFDQDILFFCTSALVHALNEKLPISRTVVFNTKDFYKAINNTVGGKDYLNIEQSLDRLMGSTIKTNEEQCGYEETESFSLIESYKILKYGNKKSVLQVEVTLSNWIYSALLSKKPHVKSINLEYFGLRKPSERRIYQIALKKIGNNETWKIGIDSLQARMGSAQKSRPHFIQSLKLVIKNDLIPDFKIVIKDNNVVFSYRDPNKLLQKMR